MILGKFKFIIISILFIALNLSSKANENSLLLDSANAAYTKGDFNKALTLYQKITSSGFESASLYFNIGNSYYKTNRIGLAILNYEKAKKLAPNDEDIEVNLKLANQQIEDKIDIAPKLFLTEWENGIIDMMSERMWSLVCIFLFLLSLILISIYIFSSKNVFKQIGFFGGGILILLSLIVFFLARQKYQISISSNDGIITNATVTVNGSPNDSGTKLFILHEGSKVGIIQIEEEWTEIRLANGNVGWIKNNTFLPI